MAYDEKLARRVRRELAAHDGVEEQKLFGGLAFMLGGHMCCGVLGEDLVVRLGETEAAKALGRPHTRPMDFTGRPMKSMVYVAPDGCRGAQALRRWLRLGCDYVSRLPAKQTRRR